AQRRRGGCGIRRSLQILQMGWRTARVVSEARCGQASLGSAVRRTAIGGLSALTRTREERGHAVRQRHCLSPSPSPHLREGEGAGRPPPGRWARAGEGRQHGSAPLRLRPAVTARTALAAGPALPPALGALGAQLLELVLLVGGEQRHHLLEGRALVLAHLLEERAKLLALLRAEPLHAGAAPRAIAALRGRVRCADDGPDLLHERPVLLRKLGADLLDLRLLLVRQLELLGQVQQTRTERSVGARRPFLLRARCLSSRFGRPEDVRP